MYKVEELWPREVPVDSENRAMKIQKVPLGPMNIFERITDTGTIGDHVQSRGVGLTSEAPQRTCAVRRVRRVRPS